MNYRNYIFYDSKKNRKSWYSIVWKWTKLVLYLFLLISMLWGCGQMVISKYNVWNITDITDQNIYKPGVFFEILVGTSNVGKEHYFHIFEGKIYEYSYLGIRTWSEAFIKTQSPFYGCFVFPVAWVMVQLITFFGGINNGAGIIAAIFLTSLMVRMITLIFSWKAQRNQDKMQLLQIKQAEIQAKYKDSKDHGVKQKQQMEMITLYRKEGVSPLSIIGSSFLSIPFLIAMYTVVKSTRELKIASIGEISLIEKPWDMIMSQHYIYLVLLFIYLPIQIISMILPTILNFKKTKIISKEQKKAKKKQFIMQGVMIIVFFIVTISIAAGVAIYWIFSAVIQILQTLGFHYLRIRRHGKKKKKTDLIFIEKIKNIFKKKQLTYNNKGKNIDFILTKKEKTKSSSGEIVYKVTKNKKQNKDKNIKQDKKKKKTKFSI